MLSLDIEVRIRLNFRTYILFSIQYIFVLIVVVGVIKRLVRFLALIIRPSFLFPYKHYLLPFGHPLLLDLGVLFDELAGAFCNVFVENCDMVFAVLDLIFCQGLNVNMFLFWLGSLKTIFNHIILEFADKADSVYFYSIFELLDLILLALLF